MQRSYAGQGMPRHDAVQLSLVRVVTLDISASAVSMDPPRPDLASCHKERAAAKNKDEMTFRTTISR